MTPTGSIALFLGIWPANVALSWAEVVWQALAWSLFCLVLPAGGLYLVYFFVSLPLRRQERARLFLDLLEREIKRGRSVEVAITEIAQSRDRSLGVRFHLLAAYLASGLRLAAALDKVRHFLPPQIVAMLKAGVEIGAVQRVLPACRKLLRDGVSQMHGAVNYLVLLFFGAAPAFLLVLTFPRSLVTPTLLAILAEYELTSVFSCSAPDLLSGGGDLELKPVLLLSFVSRYGDWLNSIILGGFLLTIVGAMFYIGGHRLTSWLQAGLPPFLDWLALRTPWRRKRMQRDFSAMLAVLLDAEVPEAEALAFAAQCTANEVFLRRTDKAVEALRRGVKLTEAIQVLDDTGEFRWRLRNADHASGGFFTALAGWHEALDAKAFQQEQLAAQSLTTALVVLNGLVVGVVAASLFQVLVVLINELVLW